MSSVVVVGGYGVSGQALCAFLEQRGEAYRVYGAPEGHPYAVDASFIEREAVSAVYVSPGFKPQNPWIQLIKARGIPLCSDIDLFVRHYKGPVIGVTGTNGKSTVTSWLAAVLSTEQKPWYPVGNIGTSVVEDLCSGYGRVVELSSAQLYYTQRMHLQVAVLLPLAPDHLDWHGSAEAYYDAKLKILDWGPAVWHNSLRYLGLEGGLSYGAEGDVYWQENRIHFPDGRSSTFDAEYYWRSVDRDNLAAVAAVLYTLGDVRDSFDNLPMLPYRAQRSVHADGWVYINNSKATNLHATDYMLADVRQCYPNRPLTLLLGGVFKETFRIPLHGPEDKVYVFGAAVTLLREQLEPRDKTVYAFDTLQEALLAVECDRKKGGPSGLVVFAPGGASFDAFTGYAERGRYFEDWLSTVC